MMRMLSVSLCLLLPMAAFADELAPPAVDSPTQSSLVPGDAAQPAPAVAEAKKCGMHGGCGRGGKVKWIVLGGVTATVIAAVAVGVAVGFSKNDGVPVRP